MEYGNAIAKRQVMVGSAGDLWDADECFDLVKESHLGANGMTWDSDEQECKANIEAEFIEDDKASNPFSSLQSCIFQGNLWLEKFIVICSRILLEWNPCTM